MKNALLSLAMASTLLAGCASIQYGDKGVEGDLKKFTPVPGKTSLYVCRENALLVAAGVSTGVLVDNQNIGTVKPNTFVHAVIESGKHDVLMKNDGIMSATGARMTVETKADELRFLWIGVTGGGWGSYTIDYFETEQEGMNCVTKAAYSVKAP